MPGTETFTDAFGSELLKLAVKYPDKPKTLDISGASIPRTRPRTISTAEQKARWAKPPGMMATGKPTGMRHGPTKGKRRGGLWNVRNPRKEIAGRMRASSARRGVRRTSLEKETTLSEE